VAHERGDTWQEAAHRKYLKLWDKMKPPGAALGKKSIGCSAPRSYQLEKNHQGLKSTFLDMDFHIYIYIFTYIYIHNLMNG
jgi:hypothetical protein